MKHGWYMIRSDFNDVALQEQMPVSFLAKAIDFIPRAQGWLHIAICLPPMTLRH